MCREQIGVTAMLRSAVMIEVRTVIVKIRAKFT